ncbi:unnamed protein product [Danaus chrysippus]|uniref:(African queen) hypothetical protein n=1 Tax=Danaus chrysippus TaxID=151541 RepID=A0A8J2QE38_9NEOP|nr:unnamed protein product [Danaus chrysippus]
MQRPPSPRQPGPRGRSQPRPIMHILVSSVDLARVHPRAFTNITKGKLSRPLVPATPDRSPLGSGSPPLFSATLQVSVLSMFGRHNGQDERRIEELHKRRNFLAAYCKLIVYNVAPLRRAADVFKHYIRCYNDYGDIIKATLSKAREINKLGCALTMQLAMQMLFTDMLRLHPRPARTTGEFLEVKELAKRFAVMFGLDAVKNREALTALHRAGVSFAALEGPAPGPPPNLLFLEPLAEFSAKLLRQDKRAVLKFAETKFSSMQWGEEWAPLLAYRNSLLTDAPDERPPPARRHYTRRARGAAGGAAPESDDADDPHYSDPEI